MKFPSLFGLGMPAGPIDRPDPQEHVVTQRPLRRILAFTGRSIDDVVNDPIAKNQVYGFFKLSKQIDRAAEVHDLERQWNPVA